MPLTRSNLRNSKSQNRDDIIVSIKEIKNEPYVDLSLNNKLLTKSSTSPTNKRRSASPAKKVNAKSKILSKSALASQKTKRASKSRSPSRGRKSSNSVKISKKAVTKVSLKNNYNC